jgi:predicted nuclease of predicted toxin-antitoxin system
MTILLDAQLSPELGSWLRQTFSVQVIVVRDIGLREASDKEIFFKARELSAVVMTKDIDFLRLQDVHGSPPQVVWITCGNTSNERLQQVLSKVFPNALRLLEQGEQLVEISDKIIDFT